VNLYSICSQEFIQDISGLLTSESELSLQGKEWIRELVIFLCFEVHRRNDTEVPFVTGLIPEGYPTLMWDLMGIYAVSAQFSIQMMKKSLVIWIQHKKWWGVGEK
jgi:hypothetical protein